MPVTISAVNDAALEVLSANTLSSKKHSIHYVKCFTTHYQNNGSLTLENCVVKRNVASAVPPVMVNNGNINYVGKPILFPLNRIH